MSCKDKKVEMESAKEREAAETKPELEPERFAFSSLHIFVSHEQSTREVCFLIVISKMYNT